MRINNRRQFFKQVIAAAFGAPILTRVAIEQSLKPQPVSYAAISIPFAKMPKAVYIRGPRYTITFPRIGSPNTSGQVA